LTATSRTTVEGYLAILEDGSRRLRTEDGIEVWFVATWLAALADNRLWP
jgi:hypothetical protein